jgi:serine/threonine protein kinase
MTQPLPDSQLRKLQRLVASARLPERPLRSQPEEGVAACLGSYTLHRPLGPRTWEATHEKHPGRLVVRLLAKDPPPDRLQRAVADLRAIARITSPIIVANQRVSRAGSIHFLTREFIPGPNLIEWIGPPRTGLFAFYQLARALQSAHDRGVAHGDLTPHNIIIDDAGRPFITDVGLRRIGLNLAGQTQGHPDPAIDASDLGTLFLTLVTGKPPAEILRSSVPAALPPIDPKVDPLIRNLASRILVGSPPPSVRDLADAAGVICQKLPNTETSKIELLQRFERKSEGKQS